MIESSIEAEANGLETNLVINNLLERATLVQQSVELDDVRILPHVSMALWETLRED
jgi:hypothetical protein